MFPVCLNEDDLSRILYWHSVFTKTNKPEIKDEGPATKIKALLISMMEEAEEDGEDSRSMSSMRRFRR